MERSDASGEAAWERSADDPVADALIDAREAAALGDHLAARRAARSVIASAGADDADAQGEAQALLRDLAFDPVAVGVGLAVLVLILTVVAVTLATHGAG